MKTLSAVTKLGVAKRYDVFVGGLTAEACYMRKGISGDIWQVVGYYMQPSIGALVGLATLMTRYRL